MKRCIHNLQSRKTHMKKNIMYEQAHTKIIRSYKMYRKVTLIFKFFTFMCYSILQPRLVSIPPLKLNVTIKLVSPPTPQISFLNCCFSLPPTPPESKSIELVCPPRPETDVSVPLRKCHPEISQ